MVNLRALGLGFHPMPKRFPCFLLLSVMQLNDAELARLQVKSVGSEFVKRLVQAFPMSGTATL